MINIFPTLGLSLFSPPHLIFITITLIFMGSVFYYNYFKKPKMRYIKAQLIIYSLLTIFWTFLNRIVAIYNNQSLWYLIPDSICSISAYTLAFSTLLLDKKNDIFQIVPIVMIIGGACNVFFPGYISESDSIFYPNTFTSLMYHVFAMTIALVELATGYVTLNKNKWWVIPIGLIIYEIYGILIIRLTPLYDALNIRNPLIYGTNLTSPFVMLVLCLFYLEPIAVSYYQSYLLKDLFTKYTLKKPINYKKENPQEIIEDIKRRININK